MNKWERAWVGFRGSFWILGELVRDHVEVVRMMRIEYRAWKASREPLGVARTAERGGFGTSGHSTISKPLESDSRKGQN